MRSVPQLRTPEVQSTGEGRLKVEDFAVATEKQIAANRANAQKSTGPKTAAGKQKSSRNAYRHGLSCPLRLDPVTSAKADAIAHALVGDDISGEKLASAEQFAQAQLELQRIRSTRADLMAKLEFHQSNRMWDLQLLVALDRYERYAYTKRRRAAVKL